MCVVQYRHNAELTDKEFLMEWVQCADGKVRNGSAADESEFSLSRPVSLIKNRW
jgi:hypothetical protein